MDDDDDDDDLIDLLAGGQLQPPGPSQGPPAPQQLFPPCKLSEGGNDPKGSSPSEELGLVRLYHI